MLSNVEKGKDRKLKARNDDSRREQGLVLRGWKRHEEGPQVIVGRWKMPREARVKLGQKS